MITKYDILKNKTYPIGKKWIYKIEVLDEAYLEEFELETRKTTVFMQNKVLRKDDIGNMFVEVEFSKIEFDSLPQKLSSFFNKIINLARKYILQLNKEGQIIDINFIEENFKKEQIEDVRNDEFYKNLSKEEKLTLNESIEKLDKSSYQKDIKNSLILLFCYPGYLRAGLSNESALKTHKHKISSNFLEDCVWDVNFYMGIYNISPDGTINLTCTGEIDANEEIDYSLIFDKIKQYYKERNDIYFDYNFQVLGDYYLCKENFYIKNAKIQICELLNEETIEFSKTFLISLVN